jgi:phosphoribosylformylglycinamidine (FGAM) synthase PurS component
MTETNPEHLTGTLSIAVLPQEAGEFLCQLSSCFSDRNPEDIQCYGQTPDHAIAIALEQLAETYRQRAEERQNLDWEAVEHSETGTPIEQRYHVMVHYEDTITAESKFEAMHNTLLGNTVVENAKITVIKIADDLPVAPLTRPWF